MKEVRTGPLRLTRWKGCAICRRKYLATWTPSSTVRLRLASVRCSWIQRGSLPRLSARANRCHRRARERRETSGPRRGSPGLLPPVEKGLGATAREVAAPAAHLISEDHEAVVRLAPDGPPHTLGRVAHGVEGEKVVLSDLELVPQVLQPRLPVRRGRSGPSCRSCPPQSLGKGPRGPTEPPPPRPVLLTLRMRLWV